MLDKKACKEDRELTADELDLVGGAAGEDLTQERLQAGDILDIPSLSSWIASGALRGAATGAGR